MKKYFGLFLIVVFSVFMLIPSLALCKNIEGFAGLKWGSTIEEYVHLSVFDQVYEKNGKLVSDWLNDDKTERCITPYDEDSKMPFVMYCLNAGSGLYIKGNLIGFFKKGKLYAVAVVTTPASNFLLKASASKLYKAMYTIYGKHQSADLRLGGEQYYWEDEFGSITLTFEIARGAYSTTIEYVKR